MWLDRVIPVGTGHGTPAKLCIVAGLHLTLRLLVLAIKHVNGCSSIA
jgi:hypothetical protein